MEEIKDEGEWKFEGDIYQLPTRFIKRGRPHSSKFLGSSYYVTPRIQLKKGKLKSAVLVQIGVMLKGKWYIAGRVIIPKNHLKAFITVLERYEKKIESGEIKYEE